MQCTFQDDCHCLPCDNHRLRVQLVEALGALGERETQIDTLTDQLVAAIKLHAEVRHALEAIAHQMGRG